MTTRRPRKPTALDEALATRMAELFDVFSDPSRVRIISVLIGGEQNAGALAEAVGLSHSAVSHQMRGLRQSAPGPGAQRRPAGLLFPRRPRGAPVSIRSGSYSSWLD